MSTSAPNHAVPHRGLVRVLLVAGTVLMIAAIFAVFANRQALDADNWAETSGQLLANQEIRTQVSAFLVDEVYDNVDVKAEVARALPPRLDPLAGPAANGLRELAQNRMERVLDRPRVQEAWRAANEISAQQLINVAEGNSGAITSSGDAVVLDLRVVLLDLIERLGLPAALADRVPADAGRIRIMSGSQVETVQNSATLVRVLSFTLPPLAFGLLGLAVFLARGRRRRTLLVVGIDLVIAGALVLVGRNVAGQSITDSLAATPSVEPAAEAVWSIGSRMLRDVAQAVIVAGIPLILAAMLAGPMRGAVAFRRVAAPWLRDEPGVAYGVAGALAILVIAWGPIPATRMLLPVLVMVGVLALGVRALRVQAAEEFPDATVADSRAALHGLLHPTRGNGHIDELEKLNALHDTGALTDEQFEVRKAALTTAGPPA
jgi:Short C-terminal domain